MNLNSFFYPNQDWALLSLVLSILTWSMLEARKGVTLGRRAMGLHLDIKGAYWQRCLRVLLRNLLKWGQLFALFWCSVVLCERLGLHAPYGFYANFGYFGYSGAGSLWLPWQLLVLPALIWLAMVLCLNMFQTQRQLQDLICGTEIVADVERFQVVQPILNLGGMILTCSLIMWLSANAVPYRSDGGGKVSSTKANMHTLQTMLETYAVDWGGVYPPNVTALKTEAIVKGREYWKDFNNPYTGISGFGKSYVDVGFTPLPAKGFENPRSGEAGLVVYAPVGSCGNTIVKYFIYGLDKQGQLIRDKGQNLTLTNS